MVLALAGCGGVEIERERVYALPAVVGVAPLAGPGLPGVLTVEAPATDLVLSDTRIAWRDLAAPLEIRRLDNHRWSLPPARLIQDALIGCLDAGHAARAVVPPTVRSRIDYSLSGEIDRFELQLSGTEAKATGTVAVSLRLFLTADADRTIVWRDSFSFTQPVADAQVATAVTGFQAALGQLCQAVLARIGRPDPKSRTR